MSFQLLSMEMQLAYLQWVAAEELEIEKEIQRAREYYNGHQTIFLTARLREFLSLQGARQDTHFNMNICKAIVNALAERLIVRQFHSTNIPLATELNRLWQANRMDALQHELHRDAVRDGEAFVIVDFDPDMAQARLTPQPRFVSSAAGGDNYGCKIKYPNDDPRQKPLYAAKRWMESLAPDFINTRMRLTLYFPDRVEKYVDNGGSNFEQIMDPGDADWPLDWTDKNGEPLGVAVVHFKNANWESEIADAIPMQDATNKSLIDVLASADVSAFQFHIAMGFTPTADGKDPQPDGSNALTIAPGRVLSTEKSPQEASWITVPPVDLKPSLDLLMNLVLFTAVVTDTPISRFQMIRQVAAEGTLKQQEAPLLGKIAQRHAEFGDDWEDVMDLARRVQNTFGGERLDEEAEIKVSWAPAEIRSAKEQQDEWDVKRRMGVPSEQIWREMGYTQDQIEEFKASPEYVLRLKMLEAGAANTAEAKPGAMPNEQGGQPKRPTPPSPGRHKGQ